MLVSTWLDSFYTVRNVESHDFYTKHFQPSPGMQSHANMNCACPCSTNCRILVFVVTEAQVEDDTGAPSPPGSIVDSDTSLMSDVDDDKNIVRTKVRFVSII